MGRRRPGTGPIGAINDDGRGIGEQRRHPGRDLNLLGTGERKCGHAGRASTSSTTKRAD